MLIRDILHSHLDFFYENKFSFANIKDIIFYPVYYLQKIIQLAKCNFPGIIHLIIIYFPEDAAVKSHIVIF